jgi:hypothetical protein
MFLKVWLISKEIKGRIVSLLKEKIFLKLIKINKNYLFDKNYFFK